MECLRCIRKSSALEEEDLAAEIWRPLTAAAKACRESRRKICMDEEISTGVHEEQEVGHTCAVRGWPLVTSWLAGESMPLSVGNLACEGGDVQVRDDLGSPKQRQPMRRL